MQYIQPRTTTNAVVCQSPTKHPPATPMTTMALPPVSPRSGSSRAPNSARPASSQVLGGFRSSFSPRSARTTTTASGGGGGDLGRAVPGFGRPGTTGSRAITPGKTFARPASTRLGRDVVDLRTVEQTSVQSFQRQHTHRPPVARLSSPTRIWRWKDNQRQSPARGMSRQRLVTKPRSAASGVNWDHALEAMKDDERMAYEQQVN